MAAPKKYSDELRERATRMALDARRDPATSTGAIKRVADQLGIHPEALRTWVRQAEIDGGLRPGTTSDDAHADGASWNGRSASCAERTRSFGRPQRFSRRRSSTARSSSRAGSGPQVPVAVVVDYIDTHRDRIVEGRQLGVEPICAVLREAGVQIAPSTYYAAKNRTPSARELRDAELTKEITRVHTDEPGRLRRPQGLARAEAGRHRVARCTVERLMRAAGLRGIPREKTRKTTFGDGAETPRPADKVNRQFVAAAPNQLWVADLTYIRTYAGWVYAAFVLDVYSRMIVGWQVSTSLRTDLALDALEMGLWARQRAGQDVTGLVHHSDRGVQYRADPLHRTARRGRRRRIRRQQGRQLRLRGCWCRCCGGLTLVTTGPAGALR